MVKAKFHVSSFLSSAEPCCNEQKRHDNSYQEIDYSQKVSPNDTQRPLPKKPSSNSLIDTYMEMGKSSNTLKRPVPYINSVNEGQESSASGEEEYNALSLVSYPSLRDCSMSSETALKVPDTAEPNPNRVQPANVTEAARVEPARVHPLRGDFGPAYQDAISIHTNSNYSPPLHYIQQAQATQTGIVHPQCVHYTQPMNKTRNREYM
ncbi:uncharacterized protein LOC115224825 isoform X2 [Octopus sinensis]|uniref:Uncharacterized protein LOC115224825 isoform X2 n=1 Tax=Octopus sinensis TaxID=2607531 RepID=A0A7E6FPS9_9MOLL|nr:uncharacterized protein LOC115224825 isoform X2 [Octopus sinensis]